MISRIVSLFSLRYPSTLIYMLQSTEYRPYPYLQWYWRVADFRTVMKRRTLERTKAASLLLLVLRLGIFVQIAAALFLLLQGNMWGLILFLTYPVFWGHLIVLPLVAGRVVVIGPKERKLISSSKATFAKHPGIQIAVAGSYGKTTMKELLATVLSEGKKVAATPANKNVSVSHAQFAAALQGDEDILIVEYGEGRPGDVKKFAETTNPDIGIITGIAPAHLDQYPSLEAAAQDIFTLADHVGHESIYINEESEATKDFIKPNQSLYSRHEAASWKISDVKVDFEGTSFVMKKADHTLKLTSRLLGAHQVGPLALVAALAHKFGLTNTQIEEGISKTTSFEHRLQPRLLGGAWILDDTYNGNIDGIKAGLELMKTLPANRKIYVTPGLVDQGGETEAVHLEMGRLIAEAQPDKVVLMQNSVTAFICQGLEKENYQGELVIEDEPLSFYTNLEQFIAAGDLVLMQNDWPDNYA